MGKVSPSLVPKLFKLLLGCQCVDRVPSKDLVRVMVVKSRCSDGKGGSGEQRPYTSFSTFMDVKILHEGGDVGRHGDTEYNSTPRSLL